MEEYYYDTTEYYIDDTDLPEMPLMIDGMNINYIEKEFTNAEN